MTLFCCSVNSTAICVLCRACWLTQRRRVNSGRLHERLAELARAAASPPQNSPPEAAELPPSAVTHSAETLGMPSGLAAETYTNFSCCFGWESYSLHMIDDMNTCTCNERKHKVSKGRPFTTKAASYPHYLGTGRHKVCKGFDCSPHLASKKTLTMHHIS